MDLSKFYEAQNQCLKDIEQNIFFQSCESAKKEIFSIIRRYRGDDMFFVHGNTLAAINRDTYVFINIYIFYETHFVQKNMLINEKFIVCKMSAIITKYKNHRYSACIYFDTKNVYEIITNDDLFGSNGEIPLIDYNLTPEPCRHILANIDELNDKIKNFNKLFSDIDLNMINAVFNCIKKIFVDTDANIDSLLKIFYEF